MFLFLKKFTLKAWFGLIYVLKSRWSYKYIFLPLYYFKNVLAAFFQKHQKEYTYSKRSRGTRPYVTQTSLKHDIKRVQKFSR